MLNQINFIRLSRLLVSARGACLYHNTVMTKSPRGAVTSLIEAKKQVNIEAYSQLEKANKQEAIVSTIPTDQELRYSIDRVMREQAEDQSSYEKKTNALIKSFTNEFQFYYLLDKYARDLSVENFIVFMAVLAKVKDLSIAFTPQIQNLIDKQFLKHGPHFSATNCSYFMRDLNRLKQNLNNRSVQVTLQLLKYHVNKLDLGRLINLKTGLNEIKERSKSDEKPSELIDFLVKNLEAAIVFAVQLKQNELEDLYRASYATDILLNFTAELSQHHYESILSYVNRKWRSLKGFDVLNLLESLAKRDVKHVLLLNRACSFFADNSELLELTRQSYAHENQFLQWFHSYRILNALNKLGFYDKTTFALTIEKTLEVLNGSMYTAHGLEKKSSHAKIVNCLFDACIKANLHKNVDIIDYFYDNYINSHSTVATKIETENLNIVNFLYYAALSKYKKLTKAQLESCVEAANKSDLKNENTIKLMKSLVIFGNDDLAVSLKSQIDAQSYMNYAEKQFLRDVLHVDTITPTDVMNKPKLITKSMVENALEAMFFNHKSFKLEIVDNYYKFAIITDQLAHRKCLLMMTYPVDKFKNESEINGEIDYKYQALKKTVSGEDSIWVVNMGELKGMKINEISDYLKKKIEQIFK